MICVLDIIDGPARGQRLWVKENQCFEIGRISAADFPIPSDSHLSRRHLLLDSTENGFRVRDVGSSNGTYLNNLRVEVQELKSGDILRAGMSVFSVSFCENGENPHAKDGVPFSKSMMSENKPETMSVSTVPDLPRSIDTNAPGGTMRSQRHLERSDLETTVRILAGIGPDDKATPSAQAPHSWWRDFFAPTRIAGLYEQFATFESPHGNEVGLLLEFQKEYQLAVVVNESQLDTEGRKVVSQMRKEGLAESLSNSLCFARVERAEDFVRLIEVARGQDALICVGKKNRLSMQDWLHCTNSLSYPSMFSSHVDFEPSTVRNGILSSDRLVLFEFGPESVLRLLIREPS
jgi:pSer/pThr/pTyr-binding forkhead associated (FHA) protein